MNILQMSITRPSFSLRFHLFSDEFFHAFCSAQPQPDGALIGFKGKLKSEE